MAIKFKLGGVFLDPQRFDYIVKTLSRTRRKDYENFIINAVWNRLGDNSIKPVSQQFIRKSDGEHYFIDLYFPQINIGVECDEAHHQNNIDADKAREITITDLLTQVDNKSQYEPIHIKVYKPESIETQIDDCVKKIKLEIQRRKKLGTFKEWVSQKDEIDNFFKVNSKISIDDDINFPTIKNVMKNVFGRGAAQKGFYPIDKNCSLYAWFPKLATESGRQGDWLNILSDDKEYIYEVSKDFDLTKEEVLNMVNKYQGEPVSEKESIKKVTFAKIVNPVTKELNYKFIGVYQVKEIINNRIRVQKLISSDYEFISNLERD